MFLFYCVRLVLSISTCESRYGFLMKLYFNQYNMDKTTKTLLLIVTHAIVAFVCSLFGYVTGKEDTEKWDEIKIKCMSDALQNKNAELDTYIMYYEASENLLTRLDSAFDWVDKIDDYDYYEIVHIINDHMGKECCD